MKILGKIKYYFEEHRPVIWRMCKRIYVPDSDLSIVVGSNSICVTEYKSAKVASVIREAVLPKEDLVSINAKKKKSWKGRESWLQGEHALRGSSMVKECSLFHWFQRGREFVNKGSLFWRIVMVLSSMTKGKIMIKLSLMPTTPGHWCQQVCLSAP